MSFKHQGNLLYFWAAHEAALHEREGHYQQATKVWNRASRLSRNAINQLWSENRSEFCLMQVRHEKLKKVVTDGVDP